MNRTLALACLLATGSLFAADWPQFMGPNRDGTSPETGLARVWPAGGPKELWTVDVADGFGGAAIEKGKVCGGEGRFLRYTAGPRGLE